MTFEKQSLCILRKSWGVFNDRLLFGKCYRGFVLLVLENCSAVRCSVADAHDKQVDSGTCFLIDGVFECNIAHRRAVAVISLLYKIWCNPIHPLYGALPLPYVPLLCTVSAVVASWYTYAPPRSRISHHRITFIPLTVSVERSY